MHVELLVEEPSMEAALSHLLPRVIPEHSFGIYPHQGKSDLLAKLESRLRAYGSMSWPDLRVGVLVDCDDDDCHALKQRLVNACTSSSCHALCRIAMEELEAWFFGDIPALRTAYPRLPATLGSRAAYRDPDAIRGGTWEALERVLGRAGYYPTGLPKVEVARSISQHMEPGTNRSRSFQAFIDGLRRLCS